MTDANAKGTSDATDVERSPSDESPKQGDHSPIAPPFPSRGSELAAGVVAALLGWSFFGFALTINNLALEKRHDSFYSYSAWAYAISFFLILLSAMHFLRLERLAEPSNKKLPANRPPKRGKLERQGLVLSLIACLPAYLAYWWTAQDAWKRLFAQPDEVLQTALGAQNTPGLWIVFLGAFLFATLGLGFALQPPSEEDENRQRIPGRRLMALTLIPFALVFGMIFLAGNYPPWPSLPS